MFIRPRSRPSLLLLLLCAGLAWLVSETLRGELWPSRAAPVATAAPPAVAPAKPLPRFALPRVARLDATTERPLFLPTRRPVVPEAPPEPAPDAPKPKVEKPPLVEYAPGRKVSCFYAGQMDPPRDLWAHEKEPLPDSPED